MSVDEVKKKLSTVSDVGSSTRCSKCRSVNEAVKKNMRDTSAEVQENIKYFHVVAIEFRRAIVTSEFASQYDDADIDKGTPEMYDRLA